LLHLWDDSFCINPSLVSFIFKTVKQVKNTSYKVNKTTLSPFYFKLIFSPTIFDVTIAAGPITFTTIAQEIAKMCLLIIAGKIQKSKIHSLLQNS
jgi:hypothetical protein